MLFTTNAHKKNTRGKPNYQNSSPLIFMNRQHIFAMNPQKFQYWDSSGIHFIWTPTSQHESQSSYRTQCALNLTSPHPSIHHHWLGHHTLCCTCAHLSHWVPGGSQSPNLLLCDDQPRWRRSQCSVVQQTQINTTSIVSLDAGIQGNIGWWLWGN